MTVDDNAPAPDPKVVDRLVAAVLDSLDLDRSDLDATEAAGLASIAARSPKARPKNADRQKNTTADEMDPAKLAESVPRW